jgi:hypothetical protein
MKQQGNNQIGVSDPPPIIPILLAVIISIIVIR